MSSSDEMTYRSKYKNDFIEGWVISHSISNANVSDETCYVKLSLKILKYEKYNLLIILPCNCNSVQIRLSHINSSQLNLTLHTV